MTSTPSACAGKTDQGLHVVAKPIVPRCNLNREYCFYLEKQALFDVGELYRMSDQILSAFISNYITCQPTPLVEFVCQGGCPKHRFAMSHDREPGLHYLCSGYKQFFLHIRKYLRAITQLLENELPASYVMEAVKGPLVIDRGRGTDPREIRREREEDCSMNRQAAMSGAEHDEYA